MEDNLEYEIDLTLCHQGCVLYGQYLLDRRGQKRTCGSQNLRYNICKRACNITSRTTYRSDFPVHGAVETVQELREVPWQVMYMRRIWMAGMPAEKL